MIASDAQFEAYVYCGGQWGDGQRCPTAFARRSRGVSGSLADCGDRLWKVIIQLFPIYSCEIVLEG